MTEELMRRLMAAGLSKQQANSITAETLVQLFMNDDGKMLIREARQQVSEMRTLVNNLKKEYYSLAQQMDSISESILSIAKAQEEHGVITEEKAKTVVALYAALLAMNEKAGADANDSINSAGYILYAYLGGQAKREITYSPETTKVF